MTDTDRPDLDAIAARADAATPGPWEPLPDYGPNWVGVEWAGYLRTVGELGFGEGADADADRAFVTHARTDVPALLAEVRRLTAEQQQHAPGAYEVGDRPVDTADYWQRLVLAEVLDIPTDDDSLCAPDAGMWERAYGAACRSTSSLRKALEERNAARAHHANTWGDDETCAEADQSWQDASRDAIAAAYDSGTDAMARERLNLAHATLTARTTTEES